MRLTVKDIKKAIRKLRRLKVVPARGGYYVLRANPAQLELLRFKQWDIARHYLQMYEAALGEIIFGLREVKIERNVLGSGNL